MEHVRPALSATQGSGKISVRVTTTLIVHSFCYHFPRRRVIDFNAGTNAEQKLGLVPRLHQCLNRLPILLANKPRETIGDKGNK